MGNEKHPSEWTLRELSSYLIANHIVPIEIVGGLTKERMIELVLKDEIDSE